MRSARLIVLVAVLAVTATAPLSSASPSRAQACNLHGSWVANNAEANRYFQAINPTTGDIRLTRGALSMTFERTRWSFGGIGLTLVGLKGSTTIKEEIDLQSVATYSVRGASILLGRGSYKLTHISTVLTTSGHSKSIALPNTSRATPAGGTLPYTCTPNTLRVQVSVGTSTVALNLRRDRG